MSGNIGNHRQECSTRSSRRRVVVLVTGIHTSIRISTNTSFSICSCSGNDRGIYVVAIIVVVGVGGGGVLIVVVVVLWYASSWCCSCSPCVLVIVVATAAFVLLPFQHNSIWTSHTFETTTKTLSKTISGSAIVEIIQKQADHRVTTFTLKRQHNVIGVHPLALLVCLSACLPACLSACLPACLPVCLSVCLVYPSIYQYLATSTANFWNKDKVPPSLLWPIEPKTKTSTLKNYIHKYKQKCSNEFKGK